MDTDKPKTSSAAKIFVAVVLVLLAGVFIITVQSAMQSDAERVKNAKEMDVNVSKTEAGITLSRNQSEELLGCTISLNNDYKFTATAIESEDKIIAYSQFVNSDNERFNILTHAVSSISIYGCQGNYEIASFS